MSFNILSMQVRTIETNGDLSRYREWVQSHPQGSLWQSVEWARYQEGLGREIRVYKGGTWNAERGTFEATALVVIDRIIGGFSTWEISRGPLWTDEGAATVLMQRIIADAKTDRCIQLFYSPIKPFSCSILHAQCSMRHVHAEATRMLDLTKSNEEILAQMHPKGRYNIALARRHGVEVRQGTADDTDAFYELLRSTGDRGCFTIAQQSHYRRFLTDLGHSFILMAYAQGKPIAGLIGVLWNGTGIYYYGASSYEHRQCMAPYLLQWEAMKLCKAAGCGRYDLLGIEKETEDGRRKTEDLQSLWKGISDFKRKFGGTVVTYPSEQMLVLRPWAKGMLEWKRKMLG